MGTIYIGNVAPFVTLVKHFRCENIKKKLKMIFTLFLLQVCNWHGLCLVDGPPRPVPWPEGGQGLVWFIEDIF